MRLGARRLCRRCGGVIVAVQDNTVISLTAGRWVHESRIKRWRCGYAEPEED